MIASVLVVDDNADLRHTLKDFLEAKHHRVLEATDGAQAFALAEQEKPHIVIMDVVMAGVYGSTATKKLNEHRETASIPIILMSGSVEKKVLGDIADRPNVRFLKKPVDLKLLEKTIKELLPKGGYTP